MKHLLLSAALLGGLIGCSKKGATVVIPANSLQMTARGGQVVFVVSTAKMILSHNGGQWELHAATSTGDSLAIYLGNKGVTLDTPRSYSAAQSGIFVSPTSIYEFAIHTTYVNGCGMTVPGNSLLTYSTFAHTNVAASDFALTITAVDTGAHTMSGTFAGTYYEGCDEIAITDGQFNLPYTVKP